MSGPDGLPIMLFASALKWAVWLEDNHAGSSGLWLQIARKGAALRSLSYDEALDAALCYGWIDSQKRSLDTFAWLQRFTPRGPRSVWSRINTEKVVRLTGEGRMNAAGLNAVAEAKANGRWAAAYPSPARATVPDDLQKALDANVEAQRFFATLKSANRYAILFRIETAVRPETRARRIRQFITMLEKKEQLYP